MKKNSSVLKGFRLLLWKKYFDTGLGLTNYVKYLIAFFGLASSDVKTTMWIAFAYAIFCFFLGWAFIRFGYFSTDREITNRLDPFVKDVRSKVIAKLK